MKNRLLKILKFTVLLLMILTLSACIQAKLTTAQFITTNNTFSAYHLFDDNQDPYTTYDYLYLDETHSQDQYIYHTLAGEQFYLFTKVAGFETKPVLSYYRVSESEHGGTLFGIDMGEQTLVHKNKTLGIQKHYSLYAYLLDQGFVINYDYPLNHSRDKGDVHITWFYFKKDNIFLNYAVNLDTYLTLHAYEVGIIDPIVNEALTTYDDAFSLHIEAGNHTIINQLESTYKVGDYIQLKVAKLPPFEHLKLYVNNVYIKDFEYNEYYFETNFYMFAEDIVIEIKAN